MQSFSVPLNHIRSVRRLYTQHRNKNQTATNKFYIEFINGEFFELKEQMSGISPMKVFKALEGVGVNFIQDKERVGSRLKVSVG